MADDGLRCPNHLRDLLALQIIAAVQERKIERRNLDDLHVASSFARADRVGVCERVPEMAGARIRVSLDNRDVSPARARHDLQYIQRAGRVPQLFLLPRCPDVGEFPHHRELFPRNCQK